MRCSTARKKISALSAPLDRDGDKELLAHADGCPACRGVLDDHLQLLELLSDSLPLPAFQDLTGRVLMRLDEPRVANRVIWRWAAAAALAIAGLMLGYRLGVGASGAADASRPIVSTYQEALYGLPSDSTEMAYLDTGTGAQPVSERSLP